MTKGSRPRWGGGWRRGGGRGVGGGWWATRTGRPRPGGPGGAEAGDELGDSATIRTWRAAAMTSFSRRRAPPPPLRRRRAGSTSSAPSTARSRGGRVEVVQGSRSMPAALALASVRRRRQPPAGAGRAPGGAEQVDQGEHGPPGAEADGHAGPDPGRAAAAAAARAGSSRNPLMPGRTGVGGSRHAAPAGGAGLGGVGAGALLLVPEKDGRPLVLDAEDRQAGRAEEQVPGRVGRQAQVGGGQDAELVAVGEQQGRPSAAASSVSSDLARTASSTVSPPGAAVPEQVPAGACGADLRVVRPS